MPIEIVPFTPDLLPAVIRFSEALWPPRRSEAFYRWRYVECPSQIGVLAMERGECLAAVWGILRPYRVGGATVTFLETHEWYGQARLRGSGIGARVMMAMMKRPEPFLTVGGSPDALLLFPRLKWSIAGDLTYFALPLEGGAVGAYVERRTRVPAALTRDLFRAFARPWLAPRRHPAPTGGAVHALTELGDEIVALYAGDHGFGLLPLPDRALIGWLTGGVPEMGRYQLLRFDVGGTPRGWSLTRLFDGPFGRAVNLVDVFTPPQHEALYPWMIGESLTRLLPDRPDTIYTSATAPGLVKALVAARFRAHQTVPISVHGKTLTVPGPPHHLVNNTGDFPLVPYPPAPAPPHR